MTISKLIGALQRMGLDTSFDELREILWLAEQFGAAAPHPRVERAATAQASPLPSVARDAQPASSAVAAAERQRRSPADGDRERSIELFGDRQGHGQAARPVRLRGFPGLAQPLAIGRALRPLLRRRAGHDLAMDEQASAEFVAETGLPTVVYRPLRERWFDVVLIGEQMASLAAWQPALTEFTRLLRRVGGFRSVRSLALDTGANGKIALHEHGRPIAPGALHDRTGRTLVVLCSDCTSAAWYDGSMGAWLGVLADALPVAIGHYLPSSLWPNTAIGFAELQVSSPRLAAATGTLRVRRPGWAMDEPGVAMPVFALTAPMVQAWARMTASAGDAWSTAALLPLPEGAGSAHAPPPAAAPSAEQRLKQFRSMADRDAQLLAAYFSEVRPLTPPVMRVIHQAAGPDGDALALAQVLLGGLLYPLAGAAEVRRDPDHVEYEFHPGLRDMLAAALTGRDRLRINEALRGFLGQVNATAADFLALRADPAGGERLPEHAMPFARLPGTPAEGPDEARDVGRVNALRISGGAEGGFTFTYNGDSIEWSQIVEAPVSVRSWLEAVWLDFSLRPRSSHPSTFALSVLPHDLVELLHAASPTGFCQLVLDEDSARYPWELVLLMAATDDVQLDLRRLGLNRRLRPAAGEPRRVTRAGRALVVWSGPTGAETAPVAPELPAELLEQWHALTGEAPLLVDERTATSLLRDLPVRIVHLVDVTGAKRARMEDLMTVDSDKFATLARVIEGLQYVPELVVIDDPKARALAPRLAISGVPVVAAVPGSDEPDDTRLFLDAFYSGLQRGDSLSEVLRAARGANGAVFAPAAMCTECYGPPDWRFVRHEAPSEAEQPSPRPASDPSSVEPDTGRDVWVLVAGTGNKNVLSAKLARTCEAVGRELALGGYRLITGGWRGVDAAVARSFVETLTLKGTSPDGRLLQVVVEGKTPAFDAGEVLTVEKGSAEYAVCVDRASYLIMLGGYDGTEMVAEYALKSGRVVLPVADTNGAARRLHGTISALPAAQRQQGITDDLLERLAAKAPQAGVTVVHIIDELERQRPHGVRFA